MVLKKRGWVLVSLGGVFVFSFIKYDAFRAFVVTSVSILALYFILASLLFILWAGLRIKEEKEA